MLYRETVLGIFLNKPRYLRSKEVLEEVQILNILNTAQKNWDISNKKVLKFEWDVTKDC